MAKRTVRRFGGEEPTRLLLVMVGGRECGLDLERVREIRAVPDLTPLPDAPAHLRGRVDVRGEPVAALDPAALLGLEPWRRRADASLVIVRHGVGRAALLVDRAFEIAELTTEQRVAEGMEAESGFVTGVVEREAGPVLILDVARLVEEAEGA